jgi:hypothetical protein
VEGASYPQGAQPEPVCNLTAPPPGRREVAQECDEDAPLVITSRMRREMIQLLGDDLEPFAAATSYHACAAAKRRRNQQGPTTKIVSCADYKRAPGLVYVGRKPSTSDPAVSSDACCALCAAGNVQGRQCIAWSFSNGTCSQWSTFPGEPQPVLGATSGWDPSIRPDPHGLFAAIATPLYDSRGPNCSARGPCELGGPGNCCNQDIVEQPVNLTSLSSRYGQRASEYILRPRQRSFFMYAAFAHMHVPHAFEPRWQHTSSRRTIFGDALREADAAVGKIVAALHSSGKAAETLLILTAVKPDCILLQHPLPRSRLKAMRFAISGGHSPVILSTSSCATHS